MPATSEALPPDWNQWVLAWNDWKHSHDADLKHVRENPFEGKNFLADQILGVWKVRTTGRIVELSEVVFPSFDRDPATGRLSNDNLRRIGVTFADGATDVVASFADLERVLAV